MDWILYFQEYLQHAPRLEWYLCRANRVCCYFVIDKFRHDPFPVTCALCYKVIEEVVALFSRRRSLLYLHACIQYFISHLYLLSSAKESAIKHNTPIIIRAITTYITTYWFSSKLLAESKLTRDPPPPAIVRACYMWAERRCRMFNSFCSHAISWTTPNLQTQSKVFDERSIETSHVSKRTIDKDSSVTDVSTLQ